MTIKEEFESLGHHISNGWNDIKDEVGGAIKTVKTDVVGAGKKVKASVANGFTTIENDSRKVKQTAANALKGASHMLEDVVEVSPAGMIYETITGGIGSDEATMDIKSISSSAIDEITNNAPQSVKNVVRDVETGIGIGTILLMLGAAGLLYYAFENQDEIASFARRAGEGGARLVGKSIPGFNLLE